MKCPFCGCSDDRVADSRSADAGRAVRRRRECLECGRRFTTYEVVENLPLLVVKKNGRRQTFDRRKILGGVQKACEKRPVSLDKMEELTTGVEREVYRRFDREVPSREIGELVMERLASTDEVAYVRFASVYRQFKDVNHFMAELKGLLNTRKRPQK